MTARKTLAWLWPWVTLGLAVALGWMLWDQRSGAPAVAPSATSTQAAGQAVTAEPADASSQAPAVPAAASDAPLVSYADAVALAAPAVVNIYTERVVRVRQYPGNLEQLFGDAWSAYRDRVEQSLGSGVVYDGIGHVVTNFHVVQNAQQIRVQLKDGRQADATVVGVDPDTDLAVLRIALKNVPAMTLGRSDRLRVGDPVLAIGNPLGLGQTVTQGIVSATGRGRLGVSTFENFIQTDAAINFGNSGGALVDGRGMLIGINTAVLSREAGIEGIGFAIPVDLVRGVVDEILAKGRVARGWVGVVPQDIPAEHARQFGFPVGAVVVAGLYVGSPALEAGMQRGDIITEIDGQSVRGAQDALARIAQLRPGQTTRITWLRGPPFNETPQAITVKMLVAERPRR
ncbi:MAG: trypsin-like peptidase domain-containing protein [Gammaproteobacteria bacterium]|nr:trypsin-like peptidase domain-containing protein [Gammaproteobacteria bacterium]